MNAHDQASIETTSSGVFLTCACGDEFTGETEGAAKAKHRVHHRKGDALDGIAASRQALELGQEADRR